MHYQEFMDSLDQDTCPSPHEPCLQALWYDAKGEWDTAHEIVQQVDNIAFGAGEKIVTTDNIASFGQKPFT